MTTTPAAALHLSDLIRRPITGRGGESIGRLSDVIVRLRGADLPVVAGLAAPGGELRLSSARLDLRQFDRRGGEVLLRADVLGHRLIDVESAHLMRAGDLELARRDGA